MTASTGSATTLSGQFFRMMDFNHDGVLSNADWDAASTLFVRGWGGETEGPNVRRFLDVTKKWFQAVIEYADRDGDSAVTAAEFESAMADPATREKLAGYTAEIVDATFDIGDRNNDGRLDREELDQVYAAMNVTEHDTVDAYFDGSGGIDRTTYHRMINDMFR